MIDFLYISSPCFLCYCVYWNTIQKLPLMQEHPGVAVSKMVINQQSHRYHGAQRLRSTWRLKSGLDRPPGGDQVWESLDAVGRPPEIENQSLPEHLSSRKLQKRCRSGAKYEWKRGISLLFRNDILLLFHFTLHYSSFFLSFFPSIYLFISLGILVTRFLHVHWGILAYSGPSWRSSCLLNSLLVQLPPLIPALPLPSLLPLLLL